jgi:hypothetical protein
LRRTAFGAVQVRFISSSLSAERQTFGTVLAMIFLATADVMPTKNFKIETLWREMEFKPTPNQRDVIPYAKS